MQSIFARGAALSACGSSGAVHGAAGTAASSPPNACWEAACRVVEVCVGGRGGKPGQPCQLQMSHCCTALRRPLRLPGAGCSVPVKSLLFPIPAGRGEFCASPLGARTLSPCTALAAWEPGVSSYEGCISSTGEELQLFGSGQACLVQWGHPARVMCPCTKISGCPVEYGSQVPQGLLRGTWVLA